MPSFSNGSCNVLIGRNVQHKRTILTKEEEKPKRKQVRVEARSLKRLNPLLHKGVPEASGEVINL